MSYAPRAILFDGTNWLSRSAALTGVSDGKTGIMSVWVRIDGGDGVLMGMVRNNSGMFRADRVAGGNRLRAQGFDAGFTELMDFETSAAHATSTAYLHILRSWDVEFNVVQLYVDDVNELFQLVPDPTIDALIKYADIDWLVGAANVVGGSPFIGAMSDLYLAPNQFLDFSIVANRRKFIDANGDPVFLGNNGEIPTGTAPAIYLRGNPPDAGVNSGTGGDFVENGVFQAGETQGPVVAPQAHNILARRSGRYHRYFRG